MPIVRLAKGNSEAQVARPLLLHGFSFICRNHTGVDLDCGKLVESPCFAYGEAARWVLSCLVYSDSARLAHSHQNEPVLLIAWH